MVITITVRRYGMHYAGADICNHVKTDISVVKTDVCNHVRLVKNIAVIFCNDDSEVSSQKKLHVVVLSGCFLRRILLR